MKPYALAFDCGDGDLGEVAVRLMEMRLDTLYAPSADEALLLALDHAEHVRALLFSPRVSDNDLTRIATALASRHSQPLAFVPIGERPDASGEARLRALGVEWGVWQADDENVLRFVVGAAFTAESERAPRLETRVPATLAASYYEGNERRDGLVYTLSKRGAFIESEKPLPEDTALVVEIALPERSVHTKARVIYSRGLDTQPPFLPGMGVCFTNLPRDTERRLDHYVQARTEAFALAPESDLLPV